MCLCKRSLRALVRRMLKDAETSLPVGALGAISAVPWAGEAGAARKLPLHRPRCTTKSSRRGLHVSSVEATRMVWFGLVCETVQAGQRLGHVCVPNIGKSACSVPAAPHPCPAPRIRTAIATCQLPTHVHIQLQGHPKNLRAQLPAPAEQQSQAKCAMRQRAVLPHKPREKFYTRTHEHFMPPAEPNC